MKKSGDVSAHTNTTSPSNDATVAQLHREWNIASDIREIEPLVAVVAAMCRDAGMGARACRFNIPVALTEALSNAIIRGNDNVVERRVAISLRLTAAELSLEVTDEGSGFEPSAVAFSPADADWLEREDGRGLFLMRSLMDRVDLEHDLANRAGQTVRLVLFRT